MPGFTSSQVLVRIVCVLPLLLFGACATLGPTDPDAQRVALTRAVGTPDLPVLDSTGAIVFVGDLRERMATGLLLGGASVAPQYGLLVVADRAIHFLVWRSPSYTTTFRVGFDELEDLVLTSFLAQIELTIVTRGPAVPLRGDLARTRRFHIQFSDNQSKALPMYWLMAELAQRTQPGIRLSPIPDSLAARVRAARPPAPIATPTPPG